MAVDDEWAGTGHWGGLSWKRNASLSDCQRSQWAGVEVRSLVSNTGVLETLVWEGVTVMLGLERGALEVEVGKKTQSIKQPWDRAGYMHLGFWGWEGW